MLRELNDELDDAGIELAFAELKDPVRDRLLRYGIHDEIGRHRFWPTVGVAVSAYVKETGVDWVDWEDRADRTDGRRDGGQRRPRTDRGRMIAATMSRAEEMRRVRRQEARGDERGP